MRSFTGRGREEAVAALGVAAHVRELQHSMEGPKTINARMKDGEDRRARSARRT